MKKTRKKPIKNLKNKTIKRRRKRKLISDEEMLKRFDLAEKELLK